MKITIFGLGAIGSNLLLNLSTQYPDFDFAGIDYDIVEDRNLGLQQYFINHIGMPKALAMGTILNLRNKRISYVPINKKVETITSITEIGTRNIKHFMGSKEEHLIIDCFDNTESRQLLKEAFVKDNLLHIGFSPTYTAEVIWNEGYNVPGELDPDNDDICTLADAASFIQFVVGFAGMTIADFIDKQEKNNYIITNRFNMRKV